MRKIIRIGLLFLLGGIISSCTENPFFKDKIELNTRKLISGRVQLQNSIENSEILVYLERFELYTQTDETGRFEIELPPAHTQPGNGLTGLYNIYYYVANYKIDSSTVLVSNGEFVFDIADLNEQGKVKSGMALKKILEVTTDVNPGSIDNDYRGVVRVGLTLNNLVDSVIVSTFIMKEKELGSVYLKSETQQHHIRASDPTLKNLIIKNKTLFTMDFVWSSKKDSIAPDDYDIIAYLHIVQQGIPEKLRDYIGQNAQISNFDFLNVPYRRNSERLLISAAN